MFVKENPHRKKKIKTLYNKITGNEGRYELDRKADKISVLPSGKLDKYEHLTGESKACKCKLDCSICNDRPRWNSDKCMCDCKELIDRGSCEEGFTKNSSRCKCECDKLCDAGEYLDCILCKCRKRLIDKLVVGCDEMR